MKDDTSGQWYIGIYTVTTLKMVSHSLNSTLPEGLQMHLQ